METEPTQQPDAASAPDRGYTALDPRQVSVLRLRLSAFLLVMVAAVAILDIGPLREAGVPPGLPASAALVLAVAAAIFLPRRRYRAWGYRVEEDELHIRRGLLVRVRTVVPFGRVQHIDVAQGPIERLFGLATLVLHTAGTRGAAVALPGLAHARAEALRDRIRAEIRQDLP